jgi:hypothetical protein
MTTTNLGSSDTTFAIGEYPKAGLYCMHRDLILDFSAAKVMNLSELDDVQQMNVKSQTFLNFLSNPFL